MSALPRVVVVGGAGKVALRFAALASKTHEVVSLHRSAEQTATVTATGAHSQLFSIEDASVQDVRGALDGAKVVLWSAGAGGKGGPERTRAVDYEGALKVFDALESMLEPRPRLLLVSAIDVRTDQANYPAHYDENDKAMSKRMWGIIGTYMEYKAKADAELVRRKGFEWTILRPGGLSDAQGVGTVALSRTHITQQVSRDDVAAVLVELLGRRDAKGLALDLVAGDVPIAQAVDVAIAKGETDWVG